MASGKRENILVSEYSSPCGELLIGSLGDRLCLCDWLAGKHRERVDSRLKRMFRADYEQGMSPVMEKAIRQLDEYFAGRRQRFEVPLLFAGTEFQKAVWKELLGIPFGVTVSYSYITRNIGRPKSVRAVANANGANPLSIFVPCHRVIGRDRTLTGYGGGLSAKEFLLNLERKHTPTQELLLFPD